MKTSDVLNDPLVKQTIAALDGKGRSAPEQHDLDQHPIFQLLEKTDALDSVTASVMVADEMLRNLHQAPTLIELLPPAVADVARVMNKSYQGSGPVESIAGLLADGNPVALKVAVAALAYSGSGPDFEMQRNRMSRQEMGELARDMADAVIEATDALSENGRWKGVSAPLLKQFSEAADNIGQYLDKGPRKRLLAASLETLHATLAADGISLPAVTVVAPAPQVPVNPSLKLSEIFQDPLVQETMQALGLQQQDVDLTRSPALAMLAQFKTLDSVTAATLIAGENARYGSNAQLPAAVKEGVQVMANLNGFAGPEAMFASDNHTVQKVGVAALAMGLSGGEFSKMQNELSGREFKKQLGEMAEVSLNLVDRIVESKSWQSMSPQLLDAFTQGLDNVRNNIEGNVRKKLLSAQIQLLKQEVAKGSAADVTGPQAGTAGPGVPVTPKHKKGGLKP